MIFKLFVVFHMVMVCRCQLFTAPMINNQHVPLSALINVTSIGEEIVRSIEKPIKDLIMSTVKSQIEFHLDEFRAKDLKLLQESNEQNENETKEIRKMIEKLTASVLKSKNQPTSENPLPSDCVYIDRLNGSGIYYVIPEGSFESFKVFCDMETDGGGWTVFQRRMDGSEDFYRGWGDYEKGFGNLEKEFWLGNSILHTLTSQGKYELRIDLEDFENNKRYAKYTSFSVGGKETNYRLTFGSYSGDAGDSLVHHNGSAFSTKDNDNDGSGTNCAKTYKGGWWYKICHTSNLNGRYLKGKHSSFADGINWLAWKGYHFSLKTTTMMVRKVK